ncbi:MAG: DUF547 domain-containing protein [Planctomycetota bacterium]|jgi:hypothetical protein
MLGIHAKRDDAAQRPRGRLVRRRAVVAVAIVAGGSVALYGAYGCLGVRQHIQAVAPLPAYDEGEYAACLAAVVDGETGYVDYARFEREFALALDRYLDSVARFGPSAAPQRFPGEPDRLAYYLNAYNAIMLKQILRHGIPQRVPRLGFFKDKWQVDGQWMSLDFLEQKLIRPTFREPRVHFALVCAARDCPPLRNEPYRGDRLEAQLDDQGRRFIALSRAARVDDGQIRLNRIFKWYREDFDRVGGLRATLLRYLAEDDPRRASIAGASEASFAFRTYDWTVNAVVPR